MMDIIKTKVERFVFTLLNLLIYFINPLAMKKNFLTVLFFLISLTVFGQEKNLTSTQLAVSGYDLVSYFNNDSPQKGNKEHAVVYDSATYYFSTEENKNIFILSSIIINANRCGYYGDDKQYNIDDVISEYPMAKTYLFQRT